MRSINQTEYKRDVLRVLKEHGPMWMSDLSNKHGLPYATLHGTKDNPASRALKNLVQMKMIIELRPRYFKKFSTKPRTKLSLPVKGNSLRYFELELLERIETLEKTIKTPWYKKIL